jgi:hypothetical protein
VPNSGGNPGGGGEFTINFDRSLLYGQNLSGSPTPSAIPTSTNPTGTATRNPDVQPTTAAQHVWAITSSPPIRWGYRSIRWGSAVQPTRRSQTGFSIRRSPSTSRTSSRSARARSKISPRSCRASRSSTRRRGILLGNSLLTTLHADGEHGSGPHSIMLTDRARMQSSTKR